MIYFVTGATGFIGRRLSKLLLSKGHHVRVLARRPHTARDLHEHGAQIFRGDVTDRNSLIDPMKDCHGVFHLAADYSIGTRNRTRMLETNVRGTQNVLSLMRQLQIPSGVYTSTIAINSDTRGVMADETYYFQGRHQSWYSETKWKAHYDVAKPFIFDGLPLVIVQPSLVYGPGDTSIIAGLFESFLRGRLPFLPGKTRYSWAHVDDIVKGHLLAMENGIRGESYILGGPDHTLRETFRIAAGISQRREPPLTLAPPVMRALASMAAIFEGAFTLPPHYSSESLQMSAGTTYIASSEKAEQHIGYSSRSLEIGLKDTLTDLAVRASMTIRNAGLKKSRYEQ